MACKLCLNDEKLVKKSHIIPDFMYKDIFDKKHKLYEVTVTKDKDIIKDKLSQTGGYEEQILCQSCDNEVLGKLEGYASCVLKILQNGMNDKDTKYTLYKEIDYTNLMSYGATHQSSWR